MAVSTVRSTCKKVENTGDVQLSKQPLQPQSRKLDANHEQLLLAVLMETPTLYLHEMCKHILDTTGVVVLEATICRLLRRHGFTRKKIRHVCSFAAQHRITSPFYGAGTVVSKGVFLCGWMRQAVMPETT